MRGTAGSLPEARHLQISNLSVNWGWLVLGAWKDELERSMLVVIVIPVSSCERMEL